MIYCSYCILFSNKNVMCDGYDDWRNVQRTLEIHAKKGDNDLEICTTIIDQITNSGYFSMSVDITPDITHMDQLTIILRYVNNDGPVERFINFIHITSHTGVTLASCLLKFSNDNDINIKRTVVCRAMTMVTTWAWLIQVCKQK